MDNLIKKSYLVAIVFTGIMAGSFTISFAQEGSPDFGAINPETEENQTFESQDTYEFEKTLIIEKPVLKKTETKARPKATTKTDKSKTKQDSTTSSGPVAGFSDTNNDSESVLSFNFLYYIIQKFKFTEVVDQ